MRALKLLIIIAVSTLLTSNIVHGQTVKALTVDKNGNVGIGTTSPKTELHVRGSAEKTEVRVQNTSKNGIAEHRFQNDARQYSIKVAGNIADKFIIRDITANENRLVIDTSGNVGIGTTDPGRLLQGRK